MVSTAAILAVDLQPNVLGARRRSGKFQWDHLLQKYTDWEFHNSFRFTELQFNKMLETFGHRLTTRSQMQAVRSSGRWISPEQRFGCFLRFAAGGDVKDVRVILEVSVTELWRSVFWCVDVINAHFKDRCTFPMPTPNEMTNDPESYRRKLDKLTSLEAEFAGIAPLQASRAWRGQCGALDGALIQTPNPGKQVPNPEEFYCARKARFGLLLMACCDALRRFRWWDMSHVPRSHDSAAFRSTSFSRALAAGLLPEPFFISGDSAFQPGHDALIVPGGTDAYNYVQSSCRMPIECAFGILSMTWGCLWKPLNVRHDRGPAVISALMHLHNHRITVGEVKMDASVFNARTTESGSIEWEIVPGLWAEPLVYDRSGVAVDLLRHECDEEWAGTNGSRKEQLIEQLKVAGVKRPQAK
jgi:hypothetical protein